MLIKSLLSLLPDKRNCAPLVSHSGALPPALKDDGCTLCYLSHFSTFILKHGQQSPTPMTRDCSCPLLPSAPQHRYQYALLHHSLPSELP